MNFCNSTLLLPYTKIQLNNTLSNAAVNGAQLNGTVTQLQAKKALHLLFTAWRKKYQFMYICCSISSRFVPFSEYWKAMSDSKYSTVTSDSSDVNKCIVSLLFLINCSTPNLVNPNRNDKIYNWLLHFNLFAATQQEYPH